MSSVGANGKRWEVNKLHLWAFMEGNNPGGLKNITKSFLVSIQGVRASVRCKQEQT